MKKWLLMGIAVITVAVTAFLSQSAIDPEDFAGEWYSANGQTIYRFQSGIIQCEQNSLSFADGGTFSGAYFFTGKKIALFAVGVDGLETVKDLYLVENKEESLLCEKEDGTGKIYFIRHNEK